MNLVDKVPCDYCGRKSNFTCSGCSHSQYCSRACQKKSWSSHKKYCKACRSGEEVQWPVGSMSSRVKESIENLDFVELKFLVQVEKFNINDFVTLGFENAGTMSCPNLTPLQYAITQLALEKNKENEVQIVKFCKRIVYELNPDIEKQALPTGYTALATATAAKSFPMMEILAKKGANVNAKDIISGGTFLNQFVTGSSIVGTAENKWNLETIPKLASWVKTYKLDVNSKDYQGQTIYSIGRRNKLVKTCALLKNELGCKDVNEKDDVSSELQTLRDAIAKVELGEMSIKDLGLNAAEFREAKRLAKIA